MRNDPPPSFSAARKWLLSLNVLLALVAILAVVAMVNYMAARHFKRFAVSGLAKTELSPLTRRILASVTNEIRVIIFYDKSDGLYDSINTLLREYKYANPRILVETVDYERTPAEANLIKANYKLTQLGEKDLIIFDSGGRTKIIHAGELSDLDIQPLVSGQSTEIKRTHFRGELMFTSAIYGLISARPLKAYFLQGHQEHKPDSDDADQGYSKFATILRQNNIEWAPLDISGARDVPADCNLLIIAGPVQTLLTEELQKIDSYLKSGGRMLALFNWFGFGKNSGLARILNEWGVDVRDDLVRDPLHSPNGRDDVMVNSFGSHPITKPLLGSGLYLIVPRSVHKRPKPPANAGGLDVTELLFTSPGGIIMTDIRDRVPYPNPATDIITNVPLAVAIEKGKIKDVRADRGTTRMVVVGESFFLSNKMIDSAGNSDFASLAINWLLDRNEILGHLGPKPIREYQTILTEAQMSGVRLILLIGMPGAVWLIGLLVWLRRRK